MNPIIATLAVSYTSSYLLRYSIDYFTYSVFKITTNTVKDVVKTSFQKTVKDIQDDPYELISFNENNDVIFDEIRLVTSKDRSKSIDQSWTNLKVDNYLLES